MRHSTSILPLLLLLTACGSEVSGPDDDGTDVDTRASSSASPSPPTAPSAQGPSAGAPTTDDHPSAPLSQVAPRTLILSLTASILEAGAVEVTPAKSTYVVGDVITITAPETQSFAFAQWSNGSHEPQLTITLDDDLELTAIMLPVPMLDAPTSVTGPVDIELAYSLDWGSNPPRFKGSNDIFVVEQATSTRGPFVEVERSMAGTLATAQTATFQRPVGYYFYRVRALTTYGYTPYSATVRVDRLRGKAILRIINDLPADGSWGQWNQVIRLRVGNDEASAAAATDRISPVTPRAGFGDNVLPGETQDFEVDAFHGQSSYYVFVQLGFWDNCIGTFGGCYETHLTQVYACQGTSYVAPKYAGVIEPRQDEGVRELRLSRFFPAYHYYQSAMCR